MKKERITATIAVVVSILLVFLPRFVPICAKTTMTGQPMRCFYTYQAELLVSLLAVFISASLLLLTERQGKILASIMLTLLAITAIALPQSWSSGICMHPASACHGTYFWTAAGGVVLVFLGLFTAWSNYKPSELEL